MNSRRLFFGALGMGWLAAGAAGAVRADDGVAALETKLAARLPADGAGVAVLVARDGKILFSHAYGLADREKQIPATPETEFRIGSLTKQFTAAAILRLAQEGRLSVDDVLTKYFPGYPGGDRITLRQMLTHTSGLHNYTAHPDFFSRVTQPIAPADLVAWFRDDPPDFAPGAEFRYSNTNYVLLGQIVEKVSGMPLGDYWEKEFFAPLGLHDTGIWNNAHPPDRGAKGYSFMANAQLQPALNWDMTWAGGAGELYSTVGDLWRWTEALQGGKVLAPASLDLMLTETTAVKKETLVRYSMGLAHSEIGGLPTIGHNGGLQGYSSTLTWFPDQKVTIAVLCNALPEPPKAAPGPIMLLAARTVLAPEMAAHAPKVDPTVDPKTYADYVGSYDYKSGIQQITADAGHLYAQLTGQNRFEIFPRGHDAFFFKVVEAGIVFNRDDKGAVVSITHTQNGATFTAARLPATDFVTVPDAKLDAIAGRYQYGLLAVLTVTRRGHQLYAQLTGQPEAPIFAKSDHEFYWKAVNAQVEFVAGPDGVITSAIHHQNGITFTAPKLPEPAAPAPKP